MRTFREISTILGMQGQNASPLSSKENGSISNAEML
jgi:hypothetical protein